MVLTLTFDLCTLPFDFIFSGLSRLGNWLLLFSRELKILLAFFILRNTQANK
jgi:hypothetical protein